MYMNMNSDFMYDFLILYFFYVIFVNFIFFIFYLSIFWRGLGDGKRVCYFVLGVII